MSVSVSIDSIEIVSPANEDAAIKGKAKVNLVLVYEQNIPDPERQEFVVCLEIEYTAIGTLLNGVRTELACMAHALGGAGDTVLL
jgi:hypothetical protein